MIMKTEMKICTRCQRELPATEYYFSKNKNLRDNLWSYCRVCRTIRWLEGYMAGAHLEPRKLSYYTKRRDSLFEEKEKSRFFLRGRRGR